MKDYYHTIKGQDPKDGVYHVTFEGWDEIMNEIVRLRKKVIDFELTPLNKRILEHIRINEAYTSYDLSEWHGNSVQSASIMLKRLFDRGYLNREQVLQETGGYEFAYSSVGDTPVCPDCKGEGSVFLLGSYYLRNNRMVCSHCSGTGREKEQ